MLDIAITDSYRVNQERDVDLATRLGFASRLLDFLDRELGVRSWANIAPEYVKFSRKAIEDGALRVPPNLQADYVVSRALDSFSLTRAQALLLAQEERERHLAALTADLEGEDFIRAVHLQRGPELFNIRNLLSSVRWFRGRVADADLAAELDAWLDISSGLMLGDTVAQLLAERIHRTREDP